MKKGFTESYIVPKSVFDELSSSSKEQVGGRKNKKHGEGEKFGDDFMKFLANKRQKVTEEGHSEIGPVVTSRGEVLSAAANEEATEQDDVRLSQLFKFSWQYKVRQVLSYIRREGDVVMWDPKTFEVTIYGKHYPDSNLFDIIYFFLAGEKDAVYPSAYDNEDIYPGYSVPRQSDKVYKALKDTRHGSYFVKLLNANVVRLLESDQVMLLHHLDQEKIAQERQTEKRQQDIRDFQAHFDPDTASMAEIENKIADAEIKGFSGLVKWLKNSLEKKAQQSFSEGGGMGLDELNESIRLLKEERAKLHRESPTLNTLIEFYVETLESREQFLENFKGKGVRDMMEILEHPPAWLDETSAHYLEMTGVFAEKTKKVLLDLFRRHELEEHHVDFLLRFGKKMPVKPPGFLKSLMYYKGMTTVERLEDDFKTGSLTEEELEGVREGLKAEDGLSAPVTTALDRLKNKLSLEKKKKTPLPPSAGDTGEKTAGTVTGTTSPALGGVPIAPQAASPKKEDPVKQVLFTPQKADEKSPAQVGKSPAQEELKFTPQKADDSPAQVHKKTPLPATTPPAAVVVPPPVPAAVAAPAAAAEVKRKTKKAKKDQEEEFQQEFDFQPQQVERRYPLRNRKQAEKK